jgi:DNA-binding IclR family transcriptional regulator
VRGVLEALLKSGVAITPEAVAERFARAPRARVREILLALETLGFVNLGKTE